MPSTFVTIISFAHFPRFSRQKFLLCRFSRLTQDQLSAMRLDPLPYTEDYFAVYNGVVVIAANPYFNFARQLGLSSVATNNYSPQGNSRVFYS
jgi:hypothetical protein